MRSATFHTHDLEERTFDFAQRVRSLLKALPQSPANVEDIRRVVKASGAVGSSYIEAKEAPATKYRVAWLKVARKEAKESRYWLRLLDTGPLHANSKERAALVNEAIELINILSAILRKLQATQDAA
jgi:four helix bundle protein